MVVSFLLDRSPEADKSSALTAAAASSSGEGALGSESDEKEFAAWVRYPTEYSERTGSMLGIWALISVSMVVVQGEMRGRRLVQHLSISDLNGGVQVGEKSETRVLEASSNGNRQCFVTVAGRWAFVLAIGTRNLMKMLVGCGVACF